MTAPRPVTIAVEPYGDSAVMVTIPHDDQAVRRAEIVDFRDRLLSRRPYGVLDVVSGLESLLVEFDPLLTAPEHVVFAARLLAELPPVSQAPEAKAAHDFRIPVIFDAEAGPDLASVARELGATPEAVVDMIASSTFTISLLGAAMAPMMDGLRVPRPVRRLGEPRTDVAAGSVMIAGTNAIIQPFPGPTGWRVVGRTPHTIVDIARKEPVSFTTGDHVRFVPVSRDDAILLDGSFLVPEAVTP